MKRPGDPVTMACYGEGSGSQARWHFNTKISKGVRKRDKGWKDLRSCYYVERGGGREIPREGVDIHPLCFLISNDRQWHHHSKQFPFRLNKIWFSGENRQHKPKRSASCWKASLLSRHTTISLTGSPQKSNAGNDFTPLEAQSEVPKEGRGTGWISEEETFWCWRRQREEDSLGNRMTLKQPFCLS